MADSCTESRRGVVLQIEEGRALIEVVRQSACAKCHAKSHCASLSGDAADNFEVEIDAEQQRDLEVGQHVELAIEGECVRGAAVMAAYVAPLLLLIASIIVLSTCRIDEGVVAIVSLLCVTIYFFILSKFRGAIKQKMRITIKKI